MSWLGWMTIDQPPVPGSWHIDSIALARPGELAWLQGELQTLITAVQGGEGLLQQAEHVLAHGQPHRDAVGTGDVQDLCLHGTSGPHAAHT